MTFVLALVAGTTGLAGAHPSSTVESCAASPDSSHSDPDEDVLGWERGVWYDEQIDVDDSDGLNESELNSTVARAMARIEAVRCLEFEEGVPVDIWSRERYAEEGGQEFNDSFVKFHNARSEALMVVGEDRNSVAVQQANLEGAVGGFYTPVDGGKIVIVSDGSNVTVNEPVLAHELTHALQSQHFGEVVAPRGTLEEQGAHEALVEGDASLVEHQYATACGESSTVGMWDCVSSDGGGSGEVENTGLYLLPAFPYIAGEDYVSHLYGSGGWSEVNAVYEDRPSSTATIVHPESGATYATGDVELADNTSSEWKRVRPPDRPDWGSVGEAGVAAMFGATLYDDDRSAVIDQSTWVSDGSEPREHGGVTYENPAATGLKGDRLHAYYSAQANETAFVWKLTWRSEEDAREFAHTYTELIRYHGGESTRADTYVYSGEDASFDDAIHVEVNGSVVVVTNAPTQDALSEVRRGVGASEPETGQTSNSDAPETSGALVVSAAIATILAVIVGYRKVR